MSETQTADTSTAEHLQTQYTETDLRCRKCQSIWSPPVANVVNLDTHPQARDAILRQTMHKSRCPVCKTEVAIEHIFKVYDPEQKLLVQVRPKWEFNAGGGEEIYWKRLEDLILKHANDDIRVDIVFGFDEMIEKYLGGQAEVEAAMARAEQERAEHKAPGTIAIEMAAARKQARENTTA
ncbi:MAG: hypothetical protein DCC58_08215 [Chloroflexi bacterium]|nr:MAG: hypothetical protein DCC58_08215 [Chloroflexota bacterium]